MNHTRLPRSLMYGTSESIRKMIGSTRTFQQQQKIQCLQHYPFQNQT